MVKNTRRQFGSLLVGLFVFRLIYGLVSEFWFEDELQIYLLGLKSFTTGTWSYYGPDVVYTQTQIAGAFQGLIIRVAFCLFPYPESPVVLLNILSFLSLSLLAFYISKRITAVPKWLIWTWIMTLTWTMDYSTRVVNPSYVIVFSIPFFVALLDILPIYSHTIISKKLGFFIMGSCMLFIMQLHLSYVLLLPFVMLAFFFDWISDQSVKEKTIHTVMCLAGAAVAMAMVLPTWLLNDHTKSIGSNIVFNPHNGRYLVAIVTRYLSFASYEIPYILGGNTTERLKVILYNLWMAPFALYLLLFGFLLVMVFLIAFFKYKNTTSWQKVKYLTLFGCTLLALSFFFSIKDPSSHTFCVLLPLPVVYSFYCYEWLWLKYKAWKGFMYAAVFSCLFFYLGLGLYNYKYKSLYKDRGRVMQAIEQRNYRLVGKRRADDWGYGY